MNYETQIKHITNSSHIVNLPDDAQAFVFTKSVKNFSQKDVIFIAENDAQMQMIASQIKIFSPEVEDEFEILFFPAFDCLPFDRASPKPSISSARVKCLYKIANRNETKKFIIITSVNSVLQKTLSRNHLHDCGLYLKQKSVISVDKICSFLSASGYSRVPSATSAGEFAVRGSIVDFVTEKAADLIGYRIDFFGNEVDSIRSFDPASQLTQDSLKEIEILPVSEAVINEKTVDTFRKNYHQTFGITHDDQLYNAVSEKRFYQGIEHFLPLFYEEKLISFFDHFSSPIIFFSEKIFSAASERWKLTQEYYRARVEMEKDDSYHPVDPALLYLSDEELKEKILKNTNILFSNSETKNLDERIFDLNISQTPNFSSIARSAHQNSFNLFKEFFTENSSKENKRIIICCFSDISRSQINRVFADYEIKNAAVENFEKTFSLPKNYVTLINLPLQAGFETSDLIFISEQDLLGEKIFGRKNTSTENSKRILQESLSIAVGDFVVHKNHGIGIFEGIFTVAAGDIKTDMLKISYSGKDVLFVPADDIDLITRYGSSDSNVQLDKLGAQSWKNKRENIRQRIKIAAEELIRTAAARHLKKGAIINANEHFYDEFKARFKFTETEDQLRTIAEVEEDLRAGAPMDRLICGDVGFGKTEIALRAAAIVVSNNDEKNFAQVSIVAPTTLLARQHYKNFCERFADTKIKVAQLSRLVSSSDAKKIKAEIESGKVDIVIGTSAILQKDMKFKNLMLAIIDEEQHFGVAQKEQLKKLRSEVHLLTLSATPIPRTLQMSLSGVKDLSLIASPPLDRIAVRNFVMPYDSVIVREAIMREYNRSGRVFFVVPRIRDIEEIEPRLKAILPDIKITHAHAKMTPSQLDKIMNDFVDGKIDVLLSTTIIESGIDISDANTIIIYKAEQFGLSQLYQLRGRVGRGKTRGYAYFMLDNRKKLSTQSQRKLEVMQNLDSLGIGFTIASHDMDIRGSGDLLGDEQSGHVKETGAELYQQMLLEAVEQLKKSPNGEDQPSIDLDFSTSVKLGISLLIPEDYMPDLQLRMSFYKKIANTHSDEEQDKLRLEMKDRFGNVPQEISNLMEIAKLKYRCKKIGVERLEVSSGGIVVAFQNNKFRYPDRLLAMIFSSSNKIKLHNQQRVLFLCDAKLGEERIKASFEVVKKLEGIFNAS